MEHVSTGNLSEMDAAFVLRNILEVPEVILEGYLKHLGDPLEGWSMELCGTCEEAVAKAKRIYQEMLDAQTRFKEVKFEVISKIMSIQQGIKCEDKKLEVGVETIDFGGANLVNLEGAVNELREHQMELDVRDENEDGGQADNCKEQKVHDPQAPFSDFIAEASFSDNENLLEFHYHIKTEEQLPSSKDVQVVDTPGENSRTLEQPVLTASDSEQTSKRRNRMSKSRPLAIPKKPKVPHGLVMKGRKFLPKFKEGPVQCKCGKKYVTYDVLLRHVKESLQSPEDLVRCEICFQQQPYKLTTFKRTWDLARHVQYIHGEKRSSCPHCEKKIPS